jgi:maltooligosyltrehalose trehalohydrolase
MLGAEIDPYGGVQFTVWAPRARSMAVRLVGGKERPRDVPMVRAGEVWSLHIPGVTAGARYFYVIDGDRARPDPRSRFQPEGVHGPSQVVDPHAYRWRTAAPRRPIEDLVLYEIHVGTFTPAGTYAAAAEHLAALAELGVTAVELMPLSSFPGKRNWGYDGVQPYAPCAAYGTPDELRAFIDAAHAAGLLVIIDVVYNHLGPEGNYTAELAPYTTEAHRTPWGNALDFARGQVRDWACDNANMWLREYRADGLRFDAIHSIIDYSLPHVLEELCRRARGGLLIAETDMNETRVFDWGFQGCWSDDFHHALHAALTGERSGYYKDFGPAATLARAIEEGWTRGPHPERSRSLSASRLVVSSQNHDQIGNRARGERLEHLAGANAARLAAVATLVAAPAIPLLFMGEEWGATTPFLYFTSHGDPALAAAVVEGRRREFSSFGWRGEIPNPQDERTFTRSRLRWQERAEPQHAARLALYRDLLALRREPGLGARAKHLCRARAVKEAVIVERGPDWRIVLNLSARDPVTMEGAWRPVLHTEDRRYGGTLASPELTVPPRAAAVFSRRRTILPM